MTKIEHVPLARACFKYYNLVTMLANLDKTDTLRDKIESELSSLREEMHELTKPQGGQGKGKEP